MDRPKYYHLWIIGNIILILVTFFFIWYLRPDDILSLVPSQLLAQIGVLLFIINVNMYFIFFVIRNTKQRNIKIQLAKFSRHMMKWHIKIAIVGSLIISGHAFLNFFEIGHVIGYFHLKMLSGYLAICLLLVTLFAGYLRHKKASGFRRKFHLATAMVFAFTFLFHMFVLIS